MEPRIFRVSCKVKHQLLHLVSLRSLTACLYELCRFSLSGPFVCREAVSSNIYQNREQQRNISSLHLYVTRKITSGNFDSQAAAKYSYFLPFSV